jgi:serine/threonine protein kinase
MGISEMQRQFSAYGSGQLPEFELRSFIRRALAQEPELSQAFIALTDAYRRANLIDATLQSTINADIVEVTGPRLGLTMVRSPTADRGNAGWFADGRAANSTDVSFPGFTTGGVMAGSPMASPGRRAPGPPGRGSNPPPPGRTSYTAVPQPPLGYSGATDANWSIDNPAGWSNPNPAGDNAAPSTGGTQTRSGPTGGSMWEVDEGLTEAGAPLYPGAVLRDRFVLVEELGRGGMGVVYKAYDRSRGDVKERYVAIKVLSDEFKRHPLAVRALQRECRKAQKLAHPNIVAVHDFDRDGGNVYLVMEFLSGRSLDQVLRDDGQGGIPLGPAMQIIKSLAAALSYAHSQDIVHCDFKPSNAFLGRDGKVKVLDFGIARAAPSLQEKGESTLFDAGQLGAISPSYASLEMLQREQPDTRDDVYAFSCVVYELLTGCHPYQRIDAIKAYQTGLQPRPIRKLSRSQWRALRQGLAFRRADRSPSIDALAAQLVAPQSTARIWITAAAASAGIALLGVLILKWPDIQRTVSQYRHPAAARVEPARNEKAGPAQSPAEPTPASAVDSGRPPGVPPDESHLSDLLASPEPTPQWAAKVGDLIDRRSAVVPANDPEIVNARRVGVRTFVAAATEARSRKQFDAAGRLLGVAGIFDAQAPEIVSESLALDRDRSPAAGTSATAGASATAGTPATAGKPASGYGAAKTDTFPKVDTSAAGGTSSAEGRHTEVEMLKEQFETQAASGDIPGATATANTLQRMFPSGPYVNHEIPRILMLSYVHLAKTQFAGGQVNEALQTLGNGRKKFVKSTELKDLEARYLTAADVYDRLSSAVVLSINDTKHALDDLKTSEGDEYDVAAQMLAQTLADRIADQRAANREAVADKLLEAGKQVFPGYTGILGRGRAGVLQNTPTVVSDP